MFHRSFYEAIGELPHEDQGYMYEAVLAYAMDGAEPELEGAEKAVFELMRPRLDADRESWRRRKAGRSTN